jgi:hypothetical protein
MITGVLTDKDSNNETLPFANVIGTPIMLQQTSTEILICSRRKLCNSIQFYGYESVEMPVTVVSGQTITSKALGSSSYKLDDVIITTTVNKQKNRLYY